MSALFDIDIHSSLKSYRVSIGPGVARAALDSDLVVVDVALQKLFPWIDRPNCIWIPAREEAKNLQTVAATVERMRDLGSNRKSTLLAIGGGIVQDVVTFAASCYMRGIEWTYCPTTLLGMVDSCIGGKSSLNVGPYKNIIGNYYPPSKVLIDTDFCHTLAVVQKIEGLCEAVKICYASKGPEFEKYLALVASGDVLSNDVAFEEIIALSLQTKKTFIESDEFDNGVRLLLNFGHTFGHAIEGASSYRVSHGVAVGLGMLASARFSEACSFTDINQPRIRALMEYVRSLLVQVPGLSESLQTISPVEALLCFRSDKKHIKSQFAVIAFDPVGFLERRFLSASMEYEDRIIEVFDWIRKAPFI